jgi:hypothetical protein
MNNVIAITQHPRAKAQGTAVCVALRATRHGHSPNAAADYAARARTMVLMGHSPARAIAALTDRIRRDAGPAVA